MKFLKILFYINIALNVFVGLNQLIIIFISTDTHPTPVLYLGVIVTNLVLPIVALFVRLIKKVLYVHLFGMLFVQATQFILVFVLLQEGGFAGLSGMVLGYFAFFYTLVCSALHGFALNHGKITEENSPKEIIN